jgi:hypothetical protein
VECTEEVCLSCGAWKRHWSISKDESHSENYLRTMFIINLKWQKSKKLT